MPESLTVRLIHLLLRQTVNRRVRSDLKRLVYDMPLLCSTDSMGVVRKLWWWVLGLEAYSPPCS
jgi:hypothetical protein